MSRSPDPGPPPSLLQRTIEPAPAKLNLALRVGPRGADGLHTVRSLVLPLAFGDHVTIRLGPPPDRCECPAVPDLAGPHNLAARAAEALRRAVGLEPACHLRVDKRIPVASGLGGGSTDAAATLRGLSRILAAHPKLPRAAGEVLAGLARRLGSDVPVCLANRPAWVAGTGERILEVDALPRIGVCLLFPAVRLRTAAVYARWDALGGPEDPGPTPRADQPSAAVPLRFEAATALARWVHNDLLPAAASLFPDLAALRARLETASCLASGMTGSGATLFGLYPTLEAAEAVARRLRAEGLAAHATAPLPPREAPLTASPGRAVRRRDPSATSPALSGGDRKGAPHGGSGENGPS